ncbi:unnamed protein product [Orchesella dallaii]|uniref:Ubiquitin-like domain-containing protein n=1 Tax=Orchesella dallaii TaxID=48710 RepID=A0ABP1QTG3_9HEXA
MGQLVGKRDEFWETAPSYEGKKEIWDALRAAASAAEANDFVLAQAILDGAGIYIPNGSLQDAYDELGNSYKVPIYCLSRPVNLLVEEFDGDLTKEPIQMVSDDPLDEELHFIRLRLSTTEQEATELSLRGGDTVVMAKMKLAQQISNTSRQRWFYGGQLLEDRLRIRDLNIPQGHIVQVVFSDLPTPHSKEK